MDHCLGQRVWAAVSTVTLLLTRIVLLCTGTVALQKRGDRVSEGREFYSQTSRGSAVDSVPDGRASAVVHCSLDPECVQLFTVYYLYETLRHRHQYRCLC